MPQAEATEWGRRERRGAIMKGWASERHVPSVDWKSGCLKGLVTEEGTILFYTLFCKGNLSCLKGWKISTTASVMIKTKFLSRCLNYINCISPTPVVAKESCRNEKVNKTLPVSWLWFISIWFLYRWQPHHKLYLCPSNINASVSRICLGFPCFSPEQWRW